MEFLLKCLDEQLLKWDSIWSALGSFDIMHFSSLHDREQLIGVSEKERHFWYKRIDKQKNESDKISKETFSGCFVHGYEETGTT